MTGRQGSEASRERRAILACAALVGLTGLVAAAVGVRVSTWALDETLFRVSAVHYSGALPDSIINDPTARSTTRLYALTLMPLFSAFDGDQAVRIAKVWNVVLWCSTAIPLWLLAKPLLGPWQRVAAVSLAIATPWIALTTALYTECMALPVFVWFTLAALWAVRRPAWWRDLIVLAVLGVAIAARTQLVGLFAGYVLLVATAAWLSTPSGVKGRARLRVVLSRLRDFPITTVLAVLVAIVVLGVMFGAFTLRGENAAGPYASTLERGVLFSDGFTMVLIEVLAIAVGLGVVALLFALPWYARTLAERKFDDSWWFAFGTIVMSAVTFAVAGLAQGGYWGSITEERYWMYPAVFVWTAALTALGQRKFRTRDVAIVGLVLVLLAATLQVPRVLDSESVFLAPVLAVVGEATSGSLTPLTSTSRDQLALGVLTICVAVYLAMRFVPRIRLTWLLAGGAALQVSLAIVPLLAIDGRISDKVDRTGASFDELAWIDNASDGPVTWLASEPRRTPDALLGWQREGLFWNRRITSREAVQDASPINDTYPLSALPRRFLVADPKSGVLFGSSSSLVVAWQNSPYVQLKGKELARSSSSELELLRVGDPPELKLRSVGLAGDEGIPVGRQVRVTVWPDRARGAGVELEFASQGAGGSVELSTSSSSKRLVLPASGSIYSRVRVCGSPGQFVLRGRSAATLPTGEKTQQAAILVAVRVRDDKSCK